MLDEHWGDGEERPQERIVEVAEPDDQAELQAILDFTYPCQRCVPGARESWDLFPFYFEDGYG
jgi:hypothetical protein